MKPEKVFKRYDIRGQHPEELDEEFAERLGKAIGTFTRENYSRRIIVCRDNKNSSSSLKESLIDGIESTGIKIFDIGVGPTDYAAYTGKNHGCVSVQVTSSHMPLNFNGFKMMYPEGNGFVNEDLDKLKDIFRSEEFQSGEGYTREMSSTSMRRYRDNLKMTAMRHSSATIDKKIVVDTMGGAANEILTDLLKNLGADVIDLADDKNEFPYRDPPNPKEDQLDELVSVFEDEDADLGLATDMDGDRITVYDGEFISGDEVLCMISKLVPGDAVASVDSSKALENLLEDTGNEVYYTRVGDPFVMDKALEENAAIAGEPNGHFSVLEFVPYNSGILAGLMIAGADIESLMDDVPGFSVARSSIEVENKEKTMAELKEKLSDEYEVVSDIDGIKVTIGYSDILFRPSGSSDKIRLISEARENDTAEAGLEEAKEIVRKS